MRFRLSILSILFAAIVVAGSGALAAPKKTVAFEDCESGALLVRFNSGNLSEKSDLLRALRVFADYPGLTFLPTIESRNRAAFLVTVKSYAEKCDLECYSTLAKNLGWNELQQTLNIIPGIQVRCSLYGEGAADLPAKAAPVSGAIGGSN
jgi:hypothetical protein